MQKIWMIEYTPACKKNKKTALYQFSKAVYYMIVTSVILEYTIIILFLYWLILTLILVLYLFCHFY